MNEDQDYVCLNDSNCLVYKCVKNQFMNKKGEIVFHTRMIPQKRLSCKDRKCPYWDSLIDKYRDDSDYLKTEPEELVDGKYYILKPCDIKDAEDFNLYFAEYKMPRSEE